MQVRCWAFLDFRSGKKCCFFRSYSLLILINSPEIETLESGLWNIMLYNKLSSSLSLSEDAYKNEPKARKTSLYYQEIEHVWDIPCEERSDADKMKLAIFLSENVGFFLPVCHVDAATQLSFFLQLVSHITVLRPELQSRICTPDVVGDAFFVVVSGTLAVLSTSDSKRPKYCEAGSTPGAECLQSTKEVLYTSTVTIARKACVLRVPKSAFIDLGVKVAKMYVETVRAPLVEAFPVLQKLTEATLSLLCLAAEKRKRAPREVLVNYDDYMQELVFATSGKWVIMEYPSLSSCLAQDDNKVTTMAGKSSMFGLQTFSTMREVPSTILVGTLEDCEYYAVPFSNPALDYLRSENDVVEVTFFQFNICF